MGPLIIFLMLGITFGDENPKDYFKILGVSRHASKNEIKKAYKQKSLIMHPDKVPPDQREAAQEKFSELNNAYEILIDDDKRQLYLDGGEDALKHGNRGGGGDSFFNFFFNGGGGGGRNNNQNNQKPKTLRQYIDNVVFITIEEHEAFLGVDINVSVIRRVKCPECHGAGKGSLVIVNCSKCNGTGVVNGAKCSKCNGKGKVPYSKCPRCRGGGSITNHTVVPVYVPQGVCSGDELMYSDLGDEYIEVGKGIVGKGRLLIRIKTVPSFPSSLEKLMTFFPSSLLHASSSSSSSSTSASSPPPTSPLTSPSQFAPPPPKTPYPFPASSPLPPPSNSLSCSPIPSSEFPVYTRNTTNPLHVHTTLTVSTCESRSGGLFTLPYFDGHTRTIDRKNQPLHDGEEILLRGQGIPLDMSTFASKNGRHIVSWKNKYGGRSKEWGDMIVTVRVTDAAGSSPVR